MTATHTITIQVNGASQTCSSGQTLPDLLRQLNLNPRLIAVEYNGEILHRQFWEQTAIEAGDCLEVVTIVGGG
jgi:sulfur carrier protein